MYVPMLFMCFSRKPREVLRQKCRTKSDRVIFERIIFFAFLTFSIFEHNNISKKTPNAGNNLIIDGRFDSPAAGQKTSICDHNFSKTPLSSAITKTISVVAETARPPKCPKINCLLAFRILTFPLKSRT